MLGRFANDDLRNKYGCTTPEECAFVQRWLELLHRKSLDTYAVKMRNTHSILREMLDTLAQVQNGVIHAFNLSALKDEAIDLLNNDLTLDRFNRPLKKKLLHTISFGTKKEYLS